MDHLYLVFFMFNTTVYSVSTQHQYISFFGYMFWFLQNHLQASVNYREVHSVCTYIMGPHSVYIKS